jgi:hypothetical protein
MREPIASTTDVSHNILCHRTQCAYTYRNTVLNRDETSRGSVVSRFPDDENTGKVPMFSLVAGVLALLVACELGQHKIRSEKMIPDCFDPLHRYLNRTHAAVT